MKSGVLKHFFNLLLLNWKKEGQICPPPIICVCQCSYSFISIWRIWSGVSQLSKVKTLTQFFIFSFDNEWIWFYKWGSPNWLHQKGLLNNPKQPPEVLSKCNSAVFGLLCCCFSTNMKFHTILESYDNFFWQSMLAYWRK